MRRVASLSVVGVALVAAVAAAWAAMHWASEGALPTFEIRRGPFVRQVEAEGNLEAVSATPITGPVDAQGPMKVAWVVPEGTRVAAGEVLMRFDPTEMENLLLDGRAERDTADSRRDGLEAQSDAVLRNLDRDAEIAREELEVAGRFQSKDPDIFSRHEIIKAEIDRTLAGKRLENAESTRAIRQKSTRADLDLVGIDRRKAAIRIDQAEKGLAALEVRSPHEGLVVYKRNWRGEGVRVGDTVWPGQPLAEIPNLEAMQAKVYVLEADAGGLAVGLPAVVTLEASPDRPIPAKVKSVATLARRRLGWVPVQYFEVVLDLDVQDPELLKPGQRVRAELELDRREDALAIPSGAVFDRDGKRVVYRRNGSGFEPVAVKLGPAAVGRIVVEDGLSEGDVVALWDPEAEREAPAAGPSAAPGAGS